MKFLDQIVTALTHSSAQGTQKNIHLPLAEQRPSTKLKEVLGQLAKRDYENFLWLSTLRPNSCFNAQTLAILRNINPEAAAASISTLQEHRLIFLQSSRAGYAIHESLRIFAKQLLVSQKVRNSGLPRLGINWTDAHQIIVLLVQQAHITAKDDIYFLKNLDWHLQEATWTDRIHAVIDSLFPLNAWQHVLNTSIVGNGFDIDTLLEAAEADAQKQYHHKPAESLILLSKYGLMRNTQKLLFQSIPEQWVRRSIEQGRWHRSAALRYIQALKNPAQKSSAIISLLNFLIPEFTAETLVEINAIRSEVPKIEAWVKIFQHLQVKDKKSIISQLEHLKIDASKSLLIRGISPHLPLTLTQRIYLAIEQLEEVEQARALEEFIKYCNKPFKRQSLSLINGFRNQPLKIRLLSLLSQTFPHVQSKILEIELDTEPDFSTYSILWSLDEYSGRSVEALTHWLKGSAADLDKVLFVSERACDSDSQRFNQIWELVRSCDRWRQTIGKAHSSGQEANWASVIISFISVLSDQQLEELIDEIAALENEEIKGELYLQALPFLEHEAQCHLQERILGIQDLETRAKILAQILDYFPNLKSIVLESLDQIFNAVSTVEILVLLLEQDASIAPLFFEQLHTIENETLRAHFLSQSLDLLPDSSISDAIHVILSVGDSSHRNNLLNQVEPRLTDPQIENIVYQLNRDAYPVSLLKNSAKQIFRTCWEGGLSAVNSSLVDELLSQVSRTSQRRSNHDFLAEIFALSTSDQSKVLALYLQELQWSHLDISTLYAVLTSLSQGAPQNFILNFPHLVRGIAEVTGDIKDLPKYGNLCNQLSQNKHKQTQNAARDLGLDPQSRASSTSFRQISLSVPSS